MLKLAECNQKYVLLTYLQVKTKHEVSGRKFSILSISKDHLEQMKKFKVLRHLDVESLRVGDVCGFLEAHGRLIIDNCNENKTLLKLLQQYYQINYILLNYILLLCTGVG